MTSSGDNRSIDVGGNVVGSQFITGDHNEVSLKGVHVTSPAAEDVDISQEIAALKAALAKLNAPEQVRLEREIEYAASQAAEAEPDKDAIAGALERAVEYTKGANNLGTQIEKLASHFAAIVAWLGPAGTRLASMLGLAP